MPRAKPVWGNVQQAARERGHAGLTQADVSFYQLADLGAAVIV